ncbi:MAG: helix-turn-helix transcriptional regulator [Pseudomonadota bacterium]
MDDIERQAMTVAGAHFSTLCRQWRRARHLSQLQLAETAAISQRHLSWLETGRSRPSREMVVRLAEALDIPLRERNTLLNAAGFAPLYRESTLDEPHMAPIREALTRVLEHHHPYPALVVDRKWNWVMGNPAAEMLIGLSGDSVDAGVGTTPFNLAAATLAPRGLRRFIRNVDTALPLFVQRLRSEALASGDPAVIAHIEALLRNAGDLPELRSQQDPLLPVIPLELDIDGLVLSLFTVLSTFGTPQDITTDELRIEAFYPSDEDTRRFFSESARA